jgi:phosphate transport system protein
VSVHLQREIDALKKRLLSISALVEDQVDRALLAVAVRDADMAAAVEARDADVDRREVELEEECLKTLALHQPVASDLRLVIAILKINSDLERIGDLAVNVAHKAATLAASPPIRIPLDLPNMWETTRGMLRDSLKAFINHDPALAQNVCARDAEVDRMKHEGRLQAETLMRDQPDKLHAILSILALARNLERIADHATNIAEDVIYLVEGEIVRHRPAAVGKEQ